MKRYLFLVLLGCLLPGCRPEPAPTPEAVPTKAAIVEASDASTSQSPSATPTPSDTLPVPTTEATLKPTDVPSPTRTPSPTSGATLTLPLPETATPAPTQTPTQPPSPTPKAPTPQPTKAVEPFEIVVDNRDAEFSTTGWWFTGDGGHSYEGDCAWAPRGSQNIAYVNPELPETGSYEVFAWWCGDPDHNQSDRALIQIYPHGGGAAPHGVHVNLQEDAGQWNSLGTYYLDQKSYLSVNGFLVGNVVADAFRFVYRSPDQVITTPTPRPTDWPTTGHPPPPVEQLTCGDLSMRLGLVQRFYPYTPFTSIEETTFDDCQAFPREGCSGTRTGWNVEVGYQDMVVGYRVSRDYRDMAIEPPGSLADRQVQYLVGSGNDRHFRVVRYPDDTWHLIGADYALVSGSHLQLDADTIEELRWFVRTYGPVSIGTPDGYHVQLLGLGPLVELSAADRSGLEILGDKLGEASR